MATRVCKVSLVIIEYRVLPDWNTACAKEGAATRAPMARVLVIFMPVSLGRGCGHEVPTRTNWLLTRMTALPISVCSRGRRARSDTRRAETGHLGYRPTPVPWKTG